MFNVPRLQDHATAQYAIRTLTEVSTEVGNISGMSAGRSAGDLVKEYLRCIESIQRRLSSVLVDDDLMHTQTYWWMRTVDATAARLIPTILAEADKLSRTLAEMRDALVQERARWERSVCTLVVPDTNMFLNKDAPFEQVDWPVALESTDLDVRIVVPLVVIHELDRLKRQGNNTTAKSARLALRWLLAVLPANPSLPSEALASTSSQRRSTIEIYVHDGPTHPPDADGVLIDFTRQLAAVSELPTVLVTRDLGMRLRAAARGIDVRQLPDPEVD